MLSGTVEVEVSDGAKLRWSHGEMFLADDVASRRHRTRMIAGPGRVLFVHLPAETELGAGTSQFVEHPASTDVLKLVARSSPRLPEGAAAAIAAAG